MNPTISKDFTPHKAKLVAEILHRRLPAWNVETEALSARRAALRLSRGGALISVLQIGPSLVITPENISIPASETPEVIAERVLQGAQPKPRQAAADPLPLIEASGGKLRIVDGDLFYVDENVVVYGAILDDGRVRIGLAADPETVRKIIATIFRQIAT